MFTYKIKFYPKINEANSMNEYEEAIFDYIIALVSNGQALQAFQNVVLENEVYSARIVVPEKNSLNSEYYF